MMTVPRSTCVPMATTIPRSVAERTHCNNVDFADALAFPVPYVSRMIPRTPGAWNKAVNPALLKPGTNFTTNTSAVLASGLTVNRPCGGGRILAVFISTPTPVVASGGKFGESKASMSPYAIFTDRFPRSNLSPIKIHTSGM